MYAKLSKYILYLQEIIFRIVYITTIYLFNITMEGIRS